MLVPPPLPDEHLVGMLERVARLNGISIGRIREHLCRRSSASSLLEAIARTLDLSVPTLAASSTAYRFARAISAEPISFDDPLWLRSQGKHSIEYRWRTPPRYCMSCVEEDLRELGHSYWRRTHQLPGVVICPDHSECLQTVQCAGSAVGLPGEGRRDRRAEAALCDPQSIITRYAHTVRMLLTWKTQIPLVAMQNVIRERATSVGLRLGGTSKHRTLSDMAQDQAPSDWLLQHFRSRRTRRCGSHLSASIASVCGSRNGCLSTQFYALALTLLFDSPEDARERLCAQPPANMTTQYRSYLGVNWTSNKVLTALVKHRGVVERTADALGISEKTMHQGLGSIGLKSISRVARSELADALRDYFDGASIAEASAKYGVSQQDVERVLRSAGTLYSRVLSRIARTRRRSQKRPSQSTIAA